MTDVQFLIVQVLNPLLDGLVGLSVLLWPLRRSTDDSLRRPISWPRALAAAVATSLAFLVKAPPLLVAGVGPFGLIKLAWLDLYVMLPLVGLTMILIGRRRGRRASMTPIVRGIAYAALFTPALAAYAAFIEPFRVQFETAAHLLPPERAGAEPITVGVLADIQTARAGDHEFEQVRRLMAHRPDLIVIPGDYFQGPPDSLEQQLPVLRALLSELHAPGGVYFVLGNCEDSEEVARIFTGLPIRVLINESVRTSVRDRVVTIGGVELDCESPDARAFVQSFESAPGDEDIRLLVSHRPDAVLDLAPGSRVDLVIAGHTHGGQVCLPWFGPPLTLTDVPRRVAAGGLHEVDGRAIYVSRGLGMERGKAPPVRFLCPPEITLLTLRD